MANKIQWKLVDASDMILGRLCSQVAKQALLGEHIIVTNIQNAIISGRRGFFLEMYIEIKECRNLANPHSGPFHHSRPDSFMRQKLRNMLPKNDRGRDAVRRIHLYICGIPKAKQKNYTNQVEWKVPKASSDRLSQHYITLNDLCTQIGWGGGSRDATNKQGAK